jgi:hypothetical protein|tara:strand:- start:53 stop:310 length:258 start_codon:yes stop_codon:yes gene_type:complete
LPSQSFLILLVSNLRDLSATAKDGRSRLHAGHYLDQHYGCDVDRLLSHPLPGLASTGEGTDSATDVKTIDESFVLSATLMSGLDV